jgi:hypothetical protein
VAGFYAAIVAGFPTAVDREIIALSGSLPAVLPSTFRAVSRRHAWILLKDQCSDEEWRLPQMLSGVVSVHRACAITVKTLA